MTKLTEQQLNFCVIYNIEKDVIQGEDGLYIANTPENRATITEDQSEFIGGECFKQYCAISAYDLVAEFEVELRPLWSL